MKRLSADDVIRILELEPLEGEGGYFRQTWSRRHPGSARLEATCIYYMITPDAYSALHRLDADEIYHVYLGDPCDMILIDPTGTASRRRLGRDIAQGMAVQVAVPAGTWQGLRLVPGGAWALLGTTMTPGYDPAGFELATTHMPARVTNDTGLCIGDFLAPHQRQRTS